MHDGLDRGNGVLSFCGLPHWGQPGAKNAVEGSASAGSKGPKSPFYCPLFSGEFEVYEQLVSKTNTGDVFVVFAELIILSAQ